MAMEEAVSRVRMSVVDGGGGCGYGVGDAVDGGDGDGVSEAALVDGGG